MMRVDVVVLGGGPAGAATALALAARGRSVCLLDRSPPTATRPGETVSPQARSALVQIGAWREFMAQAPRAMHGVWSAWGGPEAIARDSVLDPLGPAWSVDRAAFDRMLRAACESAGVAVVADALAIDVGRSGAGWLVRTLRGALAGPIESRFMVDATGSAARFAREQGATRLRLDRQVAVIAVLAQAEAAHRVEDVLLVEALSTGWCYSCHLPDGRLVAAYLTDGDLMRAESPRPSEAWARALQDAPLTRGRTEGFVPQGFHVRPAASGRLDRMAGAGWLAAGDAASALDPLSGAGVARALRGGVLAAAAVDRALGGDDAAIARYARTVGDEFDAAYRVGAAHYSAEKRWPASTFWHRRHSASRHATSRGDRHAH